MNKQQKIKHRQNIFEHQQGSGLTIIQFCRDNKVNVSTFYGWRKRLSDKTLPKSINGAQASATLYSIVMTCRANDINPYYYFLHLFKALPARQSDDDFTGLMPWNVQLDFDYS